jgi:hypothetical protein
MSTLPPKADICRDQSNDRFVPSSLEQNYTVRDYTVQRIIPSIKWEE